MPIPVSQRLSEQLKPPPTDTTRFSTDHHQKGKQQVRNNHSPIQQPPTFLSQTQGFPYGTPKRWYLPGGSNTLLSHTAAIRRTVYTPPNPYGGALIQQRSVSSSIIRSGYFSSNKRRFRKVYRVEQHSVEGPNVPPIMQYIKGFVIPS